MQFCHSGTFPCPWSPFIPAVPLRKCSGQILTMQPEAGNDLAPLKSRFLGQSPHLPIVISITEAKPRAQGLVRAVQLRKGLNEP